MSISFLEHAWLYALPALLGALVILYFLKLKRREVVVSSTFLWKKALEDLHVNSPLQRLRMNLLLLLQLLALAAVTLALARPISTLGDLRGRTRVIVLDRSASMQATDGGDGKTRLERALAEARAIVDGMGYADQAVLIALDDRAELLTPLTDRRDVLRSALGKIAPTDKRTRLRAGIDVALSLAGQPDASLPQITVISDGRGGPLGDARIPANVELRYVKIGEARANVGIIGLDVRRAFEKEEASRVFVTVGSSGAEKVTVGLDCFITPDREGAPEELVTSKELELPPRPREDGKDRPGDLGKASVVIDSPKLRSGRLRLSLDVQDALPADNQAFAVLREKREVRVLLVTEGNVFLRSALSEDPVVAKVAGSIPTMAPTQFSPDDAALKQYDLIFLDRVEARTLPPGNYVTFESIPPFEGLLAKGTVTAPVVVDWNEAHPVARFVNFASLDCTRSVRLAARKGDRVVVDSNHGPLVIEARDGERRALVCAFDILKTQSWPLKSAFPIFLSNVVRWLGGAGRDERAVAVPTGEVAEVPLERGIVRATVKDPTGRTRALEVKPGDEVLRVGETVRAGFYELELENEDAKKPKKRLVFAANLESEEESDIVAEEKIEIEGKAVQGESRARAAQREVWKLVVLAGFIVLLLEWWVYNRRVFV